MPTRNPGKSKTKPAGRIQARGSAKAKDSSRTAARTKSGAARQPAGKKTAARAKAEKAEKSVPVKKKAAGKKTGGSNQSKSTAKTPARKKTTKSGKKKAEQGKRTSFIDRARPYFTGLSYGLLLGFIGAFLLFYLPEFTKEPDKPRPSPSATETAKKSSPKPAPEPKRSKPKPGPAKPEAARIVAVKPDKIEYEERQKLDRDIKTLEHGLFTALIRMRIPEDHISFLEVDSRNSKGRAYDHTSMKVDLPSGVSSGKVLERLRTASKKLGLEPKPELTAAGTGQGMKVKVSFDGLSTHDILLHASLTPKTEPSRIAKPEPPPIEIPSVRPQIAIVIDDFGLNARQAECFLDLDIPLAFSILPFLPHSRDIAEMAHDKGRQVILHMPMEPSRWPEVDPGPGALMAGLSQAEIVKRINKALEAVPHAVGVNNHMGSRFTSLEIPMSWALTPLKERGLFFLDSRTSARSRGFSTARSLGVPTAKRSVFLDNVQDAQAITIQLKKTIAAARRNGSAIAIGHVYPITCQVLKKEYNNLTSIVEIVPITTLIR